MGTVQWISEEDALEVIRSSEWAALKEPHRVENLVESSLGNLVGSRTVSGISPKQKDQVLFDAFLRATLISFHQNNPEAIEVNEEGEARTELSSLKLFLLKALMDEMEQKFGKVPSFKL